MGMVSYRSENVPYLSNGVQHTSPVVFRHHVCLYRWVGCTLPGEGSLLSGNTMHARCMMFPNNRAPSPCAISGPLMCT
jgi:hypothetical protein